MNAFLDYMCGKEPSSELTNKIEDRIAQVKRNERWKGEFMTLYEHYQIEREEGREEGRIDGLAEGLTTGREEGEAIGIEKGLAKAVDALISNKEFSLEDACKALNTTVEEYNKAKQLVNAQ